MLERKEFIVTLSHEGQGIGMEEGYAVHCIPSSDIQNYKAWLGRWFKHEDLISKPQSPPKPVC